MALVLIMSLHPMIGRVKTRDQNGCHAHLLVRVLIVSDIALGQYCIIATEQLIAKHLSARQVKWYIVLELSVYIYLFIALCVCMMHYHGM